MEQAQAIKDNNIKGLEASSSSESSFGLNLSSALKRGDLLLAFGIVGILVILIMPMPLWLMDISLSLSLVFACLVLMVTIFVEKPVDFSAYPLVLLIATMFRLSLNLATTRLILSNGNLGADAAGHVIKAFGGFIMNGNFVIGVIVFSILVLVNFLVITKGSGRIAEVAARFSLDAMPGKQMAIDADLSAGLIDEETAKKRRQELSKESSFYGSMDGASKFVRGDAIAGIIITIINIIAGMIIGMVQLKMPFIQAAQTYTVLTVGDGLVSQIPALIVSVSAGIMVSKAGMDESTDKLLFKQFTHHPKALGMTSVMALSLGMLPGTPAIPFFSIALTCAGIAFFLGKNNKKKKEKSAALDENKRDLSIDGRPLASTSSSGKAGQNVASTASVTEEMSSILKMDSIRLEIGYGLLSLVSGENNKLTDQIKALRKALATEMGFVMPSVRIQDNVQFEANVYKIFVKEVEVGSGTLKPGMLLVMDPRGEEITLKGERTVEPTFGLPAMWIDPISREEALFRGYTVVESSTIITTHLTEIIRENMPDLLSYIETKKLIDDLDKEYGSLINEVLAMFKIAGIQRILQNLLQERVSIRDLPTILEGIYEAGGASRNIMLVSEHVRSRLSRQLSDSNTSPSGFIPIVTMSAEWESAFADSIIGEGDNRQLSMQPSKLQEFINKVRNIFEDFAMKGEMPILLTSPNIRPYVRSIIERFRPMTVVMSQNEIHPKAKIKTLGQI